MAFAVERLETRQLLTTTIVSNAVAGNWNVGSTWVGNVVPNYTDDVMIVAGANISVTDGEAAKTLNTATGSDLALSGSATLGILDSNSGDTSTIAGSIEVGLGTVLNNEGTPPVVLSGSSTLTGTIQGDTVDNTGTMAIPGGGLYGGQLVNDGTINITTGGMLLSNGGTFTNDSGGTINQTTDAGYAPSTYNVVSGGTFINKGTFNITGGTGTSNFPDYTADETFNGSTFENIGGTINIQSGTFDVKGTAYIEGGSINVAANSTFEFASPNADPYGVEIGLTGTITGSGAGTIAFVAGNYTLALPGSDGAAGTLNFPAGLAQLGNVEIEEYNGFTLSNTGFLNFNSAAGTGPIWLNNSGTIQNSGTGDIQIVALTNTSAGLIDLQTNGGLLSGTINIAQNLLNMGTLRKSGGSGTSNVSATISNQGGTIDVESGTLNLNSASSSYYEGGPVHVASGATIDIDPATALVVSGTLAPTGTGMVQLTGGYIRGRNSTTGSEGTLPGVLDFAPNTFKIIAGFINNSNEGITNNGSIDFPNGATVGSFTNNGTVSIDGGQVLFNGITTNDSTGVFDFTNDATVAENAEFTNLGTIEKTGGSGTFSLGSFGQDELYDGTDRLKNMGLIESTSGDLELPADIFTVGAEGKLYVQAGNTVAATGGGTITLVSSWDVSALTITTIDGSVTVGGPGLSIPALAPLATVNGTFEVLSGTTFSTAGSLGSTGTLAIGGDLTVNGTLTETGSAADLNFLVSGAPGGSGAPLLTVTGSTALSGNLSAALANGFAATADSAYAVTTFASPSTGSFASTSGVGPAFTATVSPTSIILNGTGNNGGGGGTTGTADLAVTSVTGPDGGAPGTSITVDFVVTNEGTATVTGHWLDSVFLTTNGTLDNNSILIGRFDDSQTLAPGASYNESIPTFLPLTPAGTYTVVVETDSGQKIPDPNRANNIGVSSAFTTSFPTLTLGQSTTDTINTEQDKVYLLTLPAGADVSSAATFTKATQADLYVSYHAIPSTSQYQESLLTSTLTPQQLLSSSGAPRTLVIPVHQAGNYYVLVHGREGADGNSTFTLTPTQIPFGAVSITPSGIVQPQGNFTTVIKGAGFTPATTVALVSGSTTVTPASLLMLDSNTLSASFYFDFPPPGAYDLQVTNGSSTATLPQAFKIGNGSGNGSNLTFDLVFPSTSRGDLTNTAYLEYSNTGYLDVPAPYFYISGDNTSFKLAGDPAFSDGSIEVLGISQTGNPAILAPGQGGMIPVQYTQTGIVSHQNSDISVSEIDPAATIDLSVLKADLKPAGEPSDAWDAIFANFMSEVGTTVGGLTTVLENAATALARQGTYSGDPSVLLSYALQEAGDFGAITERYTLGAFGRGQQDPFNEPIAADASGDVTITTGGQERVFLIQTNGTYQGANGDPATLTHTGGVYTLREATGELTVFNTDGTLNYFQDTNGNRLTANYVNEQLSTLVATDGDTYTFTYNSFGRVAQVTDPEGRNTTFTYDSTGQLLDSITTPTGTTTFTYYSGSDAADQYAITSIAYPDGTHRFYTFDGNGRLINQTSSNGVDNTTFTYDDFGDVTQTDPLGNVTTEALTPNGLIASIQDGLGNIARIAYDQNGRPTSSTSPGGFATSLTYDSNGNPITSTDPNGNTTNFSYDPTLDRLLSLTDANANKTNYTYDANGNVTSITDAGGEATTYAYDSAGNLTHIANPNSTGQTITYYPDNLVEQRTYSDGSTVTYTYDAHRNLLTAVDSITGTVAYTYDSADRLTSVTYPSGLSLTYTYNASGQLTSLVDQIGFATNYVYDSLGRLSQITNSAGTVMTSYTYDAASHLSRTDNANGSFTTYTYNANGNATSVINNTPGSGVASSFTYTFNADNERTSMVSQVGTTTYTYDPDGELTRVVLPGGRTITYGYDAVGNRVEVSDSASSTVTYTTNGTDEYTTVGGTTYTYDNAGNLISSTTAGVTTSYTYNARGQLASITTPSDTITYQYDGVGDRISSMDNGVLTNYLISPNANSSILGTFNSSGNVLDHYVYGLGLSSSVDSADVSSFYGFDGTGNTADITGPAGNVTNTYTYLPFGALLSSTGSGTNSFTFNGEFGVQSAAAGLYLTPARAYDSTTGRFIQRDPTGLSAGDVNLYRYANNDPVNNNDPTGLQFVFTPEILGLDYVVPTLTQVAKNVLPALEIPTGTATAEAIVTRQVVLRGGTQAAASNPVGAVAVASLIAANEFGKDASKGLQALNNTVYSRYADQQNLALQKVLSPEAYQKALQNPLARELLQNLADQNIVPTEDFIQNAFKLDADLVRARNTPPSNTQTHDGNTMYINSRDPNDIIGPAGFGSAGYISGSGALPYEITFENDPTASAPAKIVTITEQLDANLDWTTFQFASLGFGSHFVTVPAGLTSYQTSVIISDSLRVDIVANFNVLTGALTWTFISIDPSTGDVPSDALAGFLPPDDAAGDGDGFVSYLVAPQTALATGTQIHAQGTIVFDGNAPIGTPNILNTIDGLAPTSSITTLAATQSSPYFTLSWSGSDDPNGSGLAYYDIYLSEDGGAFTPFLTHTTATSIQFLASPGHTYAFYSLATDNAGNQQAVPAAAQATTAVPAITRTINFGGKTKASYTDSSGKVVTITISGPGTGILTFLANGNADPISMVLSDTTAKSKLSVKVAGGTASLGSVQINGSLASFTAPDASFAVTFTVTGTLGSLSLGDETLTQSTIDIQGSDVPTTIKVGTVHDLTLIDAAPIKSLSANSWTAGSFSADAISAPSIGTLSIKGNFDAAVTLTADGLDLKSAKITGNITGGSLTAAGTIGTIAANAVAAAWTSTIAGEVTTLQTKGDFDGSFNAVSLGSAKIGGNLAGATLNFTGSSKGYALKSLTVTKAATNATISSTDSISSITVGGASNSRILIGVSAATTTLPTDASAFTANSSLAIFTSKGSSVFSNTIIAAASIGTAKIANITTNNSGVPFGLSTKSLASLTATPTGAKPIIYTKKQSTSILANLPGDLHVELL
ncbi:MAG TPA: RHS repeat-associated core domain-containing protein [Tepidisphaeraceae bacterium]|jgi:RHS repeat-associated protein